MVTESGKFSKLVKEVRKHLGISQEDLAHALGVSFVAVNRWEHAKTSPSKLARLQFKGLRHKIFLAMLLDGQNNLLSERVISEGIDGGNL